MLHWKITSLQTESLSEAFKNLVFKEQQALNNKLLDESFESSNPVKGLGELVGAVLVIAGPWEVGSPKAGEKEGKEEIKDDQVADHDGGEEEGDTDFVGDPHAVPHGLDPLPAQHAEHDHEAVHEVNKIPSGHRLQGEAVHIIWSWYTHWNVDQRSQVIFYM